MAKRTTRFAIAIFVSALGSCAIPSMVPGTARAAERQQASSAWDFARPTPPKIRSRRTEATSPRAPDAATDPSPRIPDDDLKRLPKMPFPVDVPNAAEAPQTAPINSGPPAEPIGSPWPQPQAQTQSPDAAASDPPPATLTTPDAEDNAVAPLNADTRAAVADAPIASDAQPPAVPVRMLLLVVIGALSLSGLLASAVSRIGRMRSRKANWRTAMAGAQRSRRPRAASRANTVDLRTQRDDKSAAKPAETDMPVIPLSPKIDEAAARSIDPTAELIDLLETRFVPPTSTPGQSNANAPEPVAPETTTAEAPTTDLIELLRAGTKTDLSPSDVSTPPKPAVLPASISADGDEDATRPPLDFIPRPAALRPHRFSVKQDTSLDGITDILARLARHA